MMLHAFNKKLKCLPWQICSRCGLIALSNSFTLWCIRHGCDYDEHPDFPAQRRKAGMA